MLISNIRHTGIVVKDISKSLDFYQSLGFELISREVEKGNFISTVVGYVNTVIETAKLKIENGSMIELIEYLSPSYTRYHNGNYPPNMHGCSHIAFTVNNVVEMAKLIEGLGGSIVNKPSVSENGSVKVMYCYDIDGILIEMVEEL